MTHTRKLNLYLKSELKLSTSLDLFFVSVKAQRVSAILGYEFIFFASQVLRGYFFITAIHKISNEKLI